MASLTEIPIETATLPPPISRLDTDKEAEKLKKQRELPARPGNDVSFKELCAWLKLLDTIEKRNRISIYVYRFHPSIIRQQADPTVDNNIDVIVDGFDKLSEQYFIDNHGGGTYGLTIADCDGYKKGKDSPGYFRCKLEIPITEYEPKLNWLEVDWTSPKNKGFQSWARSRGKIDNQNMPITPGSTATSKDTPVDRSTETVQVMRTMIDLFKGLNDGERDKVKRGVSSEPDPLSKAVGELMVKQMEQNDPNKALTAMTQMIGAMNAAKPIPQSSGLAEILPFMQMMMESQNKSTMLLMEIFRAQQQTKEPAGDTPNKISELRELIGLAKELKGGGSTGDSRTTTEMLIDKGLDILTPVIGVVGNIVAMNMASKGMTPVVPINNAPGTPQPMPVSNQGNNKVTPITQPQGLNAVPSPINEPAQLPPSDTGQLVQAMREFAPLILSNLDKDGFQLPEMVCNFFPNGNMIVAMIIRHGVDGILGAMKQVPELWNQIMQTYGEEHTKQWLDDFVHYKEILADMDREDETEEKGEEKN